MDMLYKIGITFGVLVAYCFGTIGTALIVEKNNPNSDPLFLFALSYTIGLCAFMILAFLYFEKAGLWI